MNNYEGKLGEWLKYVQQQVDAAGQPKKEDQPKEAETEATEKEELIDQPESVSIRDRFERVPRSERDAIDSEAAIADFSLIEPPQSLDRRAGLFDDADIPDVEEYLPFLREPEDRLEPPAEQETPEDQGLLFVPEGTGEPKPVTRLPKEPEAIPQRGPETIELPVAKREFAPKRAEVAQRSYRRFTESREELIARLLDPPLTLEETARILDVCPTTVRRYTNRGALKHFRTAGNQRRFRLSDVLAFLESTRHFDQERK